MEFTYVQSQIYLFEFEPVVIEDIRVVVGIGEHIVCSIDTNLLPFFFNKTTFFHLNSSDFGTTFSVNLHTIFYFHLYPLIN
jgi:hypothetical protein